MKGKCMGVLQLFPPPPPTSRPTNFGRARYLLVHIWLELEMQGHAPWLESHQYFPFILKLTALIFIPTFYTSTIYTFSGKITSSASQPVPCGPSGAMMRPSEGHDNLFPVMRFSSLQRNRIP